MSAVWRLSLKTWEKIYGKEWISSVHSNAVSFWQSLRRQAAFPSDMPLNRTLGETSKGNGIMTFTQGINDDCHTSWPTNPSKWWSTLRKMIMNQAGIWQIKAIIRLCTYILNTSYISTTLICFDTELSHSIHLADIYWPSQEHSATHSSMQINWLDGIFTYI